MSTVTVTSSTSGSRVCTVIPCCSKPALGAGELGSTPHLGGDTPVAVGSSLWSMVLVQPPRSRPLQSGLLPVDGQIEYLETPTSPPAWSVGSSVGNSNKWRSPAQVGRFDT